MHHYLNAKLQLRAKNATDNTVVVTNKESNSLLPKWVKETIEIIDIGQDDQAQVIFSIVIPNLNLQSKHTYESFYYILATNTVGGI